MPLYSYQCGSCDASFDDLVRLGTPDADIECPHCSAHAATRQLTAHAAPPKSGASVAACGAGMGRGGA